MEHKFSTDREIENSWIELLRNYSGMIMLFGAAAALVAFALDTTPYDPVVIGDVNIGLDKSLIFPAGVIGWGFLGYVVSLRLGFMQWQEDNRGTIRD